MQVDALNPNSADPDLVGELIRKNLNVVHPDEVVILLQAGSANRSPSAQLPLRQFRMPRGLRARRRCAIG